MAGSRHICDVAAGLVRYAPSSHLQRGVGLDRTETRGTVWQICRHVNMLMLALLTLVFINMRPFVGKLVQTFVLCDQRI